MHALAPPFPALAFVDIETTGGHAERDRVTEVAVITMDDDGEVHHWSQLVNPGVAIPAFIQSLTGINDAIWNWFYGHNVLGLWFTTGMMIDRHEFASEAAKVVALDLWPNGVDQAVPNGGCLY